VTSAVLDSSALLAVIHGEPGADAVLAVMADAAISTVNVAEVMSKLMEGGTTLDHARDWVRAFDLAVIDFDLPLAEAVGELRIRTRRAALSIGDRACLALALRESVPVLTADRAWCGLDLGIDVRMIR
jgi:PIN domain nuclease of toxin-antitoxin system